MAVVGEGVVHPLRSMLSEKSAPKVRQQANLLRSSATCKGCFVLGRGPNGAGPKWAQKLETSSRPGDAQNWAVTRRIRSEASVYVYIYICI